MLTVLASQFVEFCLNVGRLQFTDRLRAGKLTQRLHPVPRAPHQHQIRVQCHDLFEAESVVRAHNGDLSCRFREITVAHHANEFVSRAGSEYVFNDVRGEGDDAFGRCGKFNTPPGKIHHAQGMCVGCQQAGEQKRRYKPACVEQAFDHPRSL